MTAFHKITINQTSCQILGVLSSKHSSYFVAKYLCRLFNACFCMFLECSKILETPTGHSTETIHGHSRSYCRKPLADRLAPRVPATAQHVNATWLGHVNTIPLGDNHEKNIKTKQTKKRCPASFRQCKLLIQRLKITALFVKPIAWPWILFTEHHNASNFFLSQSNSPIPIKHNHTKPNTNSIFWTAWTSWIRAKSYSDDIQYIQFPRKTICKETPLPSTGAWHNSRPPNEKTSCGPGVLSRGHWPARSSRIFGYSKCWFSSKLLPSGNLT